MPKSSDVRAVVRHAFIQNAAVVTLLGADGEVFPAHTLRAAEVTQSHPAVIIEMRGGRDFISALAGWRRAFIYAYSAVAIADAEELYEACRVVLNREGVEGRRDEAGDLCEPTCVYGIEEDGTFDGWNPETRSWFVRGEWRLLGIG